MILVVQEYGQDCPNKILSIAHIADDIQKQSKTFYLLFI
jgi:hypothetical protein